MAIVTRPLSASEIQKAKPSTKPYLLFDGKGLCLQVKPSGKKYWRFRYTRPSTGKATEISLGSYPELSLADARVEHQKYLSLLAKGIDPKDLEREAKTQVKMTEESRFSVVAKKWHDVKKEYVSEKHAAQIWSSLERDVFPALGNLSVTEIKAPTLITALKPVEVRGALETLSRLIQRINEIMMFAVNMGLIEANPLSCVGQVFKKPQTEHMPTIRPERMPELTRRIETTNLGLLTRYLIKWQLLTLTRPVEAAEAEWSEIDMDKKIWTIPKKRMKKRREHQIPLSPEALWILEQLKPLSQNSRFLFPSRIHLDRSMHRQTVNAALKRIGYKGELVSHGFRAIGSTAMNEAGFTPDIIEAALAHVESNKTRAAYNRSTYLEQRVELMAWWGKQISATLPAMYGVGI